MNIFFLEENETVRFAADELALYLERMTGHSCKIEWKNQYTASRTALWVGTLGQFGLAADHEEEVYIDTCGRSGIIGGSHAGSVLISVYRYLTELGCRWLMPGERGEYLPQIGENFKNVKVIERPSYKHRGICIEGAVSFENVLDMVRWLPKVGLNSYFIQFRESYIFFKRWYEHRGNPLKEDKDSFVIHHARDYVTAIVKEIKQRGLTFHAVGHGWTCEPFGIPGESWDVWNGKMDPSVNKYFALVNGERKLWDGVPLNTSICFANKAARDIIVKDVCQYSIAHPEVDVIHFWLSDGANNQCECEQCIKERPSDQYVALLNDIDAMMLERGLQTKIAFALYWDTLWPPETERLLHADRFILMFAPITRSYRTTYSALVEFAEKPEYKKNRLDMPETVEGNLSFLYEWRKHFNGDAFVFDYHMMWAHHKDPGYGHISHILHDDIIRLEDLGLNGLISCQVQRCFFPNGLAMTVLAKTLWDKTVSFDGITEDYFMRAYGADWIACKKYLFTLSELYFSLGFSLTPDEAALTVSTDKTEICNRIIDVLDGFKADLDKSRGDLDSCQDMLWSHLRLHHKIWRDMAAALRYLYSGNGNKAVFVWAELKRWLWEKEDECQNVLDVFDFVRTWDVLLEQKRLKS